VVVSGDHAAARDVEGGCLLDDLLASDPLAAPVDVDPDAPAMIGYTSGTTSDPKGVIHSHRSLVAEVRQLASTVHDPHPTVMASPLAHMTGMLGGSLVPLHNGVAIELIDRWDPGRVLAIMAEHRIGAGGGATVFLTTLLDHPDFTAEHARTMARMGLGGAPVPAAVADRAEQLGISITRAYGSTEHPSITGSSYDAALRARTRTDGSPLPGVEVRLVDGEGDDVRVGTPGEILSRGPDLFVGYTDTSLTEEAFDGTWYRTGDIGVRDDEGCLTITDRVSDVIIRGGMNLSPNEIESRIATMAGIAAVAVVGLPDDRLGERACAVIQLRHGVSAPDLAALRAHLDETGLPRQKWPEALSIVDEFPRTPSGKVKKRDLRVALRADDEPPVGRPAGD
jgi:acyl-CoA synthetase